MGNVNKMYTKQQQKNGASRLVGELRSRFRIRENINNYTEKAFKKAERKFVKLSLLGRLS